MLYQLSQEGNLSQRQMAVWLGCHQSTISRELKRNQSSLGCYTLHGYNLHFLLKDNNIVQES
ncbi:transposase domain protein [Microcystis aeruginosa TAIHU98]|uniref:Transposase domain protein n=1 Tax=Microcystis aeruginosa TAIHU98 TaxID=1134457 RepID=L7EBS6_MICAE|nr:transposase domain protein [Microcystis aeruginosa TAIHU98]ODV39881.1 Mobile element protein [Microcystis aeruginosa NIES-98]